jgi:hypothetical protein
VFDHSKRKSFLTRCLISLERLIKVAVFDCSMCGQCIVRSTGLTCPMQCPKQMRNGPCGGSVGGRCEVDTSKPCVWVTAYQRAARLGPGMNGKLDWIQPPVDWRLWGTSAWQNIAHRTITIHGHPIAQGEGELS